MKIGLMAAVVLSVLALVACGGGSGGASSKDVGLHEGRAAGDTLTPSPPKELRPLSKQSALGEAVTVDAGLLPPPVGEPRLSGKVELTFRAVDRHANVSNEGRARAGGGASDATFEPRQGVYLVVHYTVTNNSDEFLQPETYVNEIFTLADQEGREWVPGTFANYGFAVAYAFALEVGGADPRDHIGPGKSLDTAVAFDVPKTVSGLRLRSERLNLEVSLGQ